MALASGILRHPVRVERPVETARADGGVDRVFAFVTEAFAEISESGSRQVREAQQVYERVDAVIRLRWLSGLGNGWRVVYGSDTYELVNVSNPDGQRVEHRCIGVRTAA